jgi:iron-sulfur cluster assembly protein
MSDFNVTDLAVSKLKEYMAQNNIDSALRVALMQGGCSGPSLGLALDEPKDNDTVFENNSLKFLIEKGLLETCGSINVEYLDARHKIRIWYNLGQATRRRGKLWWLLQLRQLWLILGSFLQSVTDGP